MRLGGHFSFHFAPVEKRSNPDNIFKVLEENIKFRKTE
jgi:hypothetical protein